VSGYLSYFLDYIRSNLDNVTYDMQLIALPVIAAMEVVLYQY
jgi:hypothetical protein